MLHAKVKAESFAHRGHERTREGGGRHRLLPSPPHPDPRVGDRAAEMLVSSSPRWGWFELFLEKVHAGHAKN